MKNLNKTNEQIRKEKTKVVKNPPKGSLLKNQLMICLKG